MDQYFDTKTFTTIAAVAAKGVPCQVKYTHEMEILIYFKPDIINRIYKIFSKSTR